MVAGLGSLGSRGCRSWGLRFFINGGSGLGFNFKLGIWSSVKGVG